MFNLKSFFSVSFISVVIAFVLILLGIKYHWGDYFKEKEYSFINLPIPKSQFIEETEPDEAFDIEEFDFTPEILDEKGGNSLVASMNRDQVEEQCFNLLIRNIKDLDVLELATINCVLSNYQEDFQDRKDGESQSNLILELTISQQCFQQYSLNSLYSETEMQLLVGICVSDRLVTRS